MKRSERDGWEFREMAYEDYSLIKSTMKDFDHVYDHKAGGVWARFKPPAETSGPANPLVFLIGIGMTAFCLWSMSEISKNASKEPR